MVDGDARSALNGLELAVHAKRMKPSSSQPTAQESPTTKQSISTNQAPQPDHELTATGEHSKGTSDNCGREGDYQEHCEAKGSKRSCVTVQDIMDSLQRSHLLYDRAGEEHYNIISALHKSMRGGDANASLYWLARMLCAGEDPLYVARRVVRFASEDIGKSSAQQIALHLPDQAAVGTNNLLALPFSLP